MVFALTLHRCALPGGEGAVTSCIGFVRLCTFVSLPCIWAVATAYYEVPRWRNLEICVAQSLSQIRRLCPGQAEPKVQICSEHTEDYQERVGLSFWSSWIQACSQCSVFLCLLCSIGIYLFNCNPVFLFQLDFAFHSLGDYNKSIAIVLFCSLSWSVRGRKHMYFLLLTDLFKM